MEELSMADENDQAQEVMTPIAQKYREEVQWFNQRLANARIHNSELERKIAKYRKWLLEAKDLLEHVETFNKAPVARSMKADRLLEELTDCFHASGETANDV
jgi:hypothetical protein